MFFRHEVAFLCCVAVAWASCHHEPAFVPLLPGLPRRQDDTKIARRRCSPAFNASYSSKPHFATPRGNIAGNRHQRARLSVICDSRLLARSQEMGDRLDQNCVSESDDCEPRDDKKGETMAVTIFRSIAKATPRKRKKTSAAEAQPERLQSEWSKTERPNLTSGSCAEVVPQNVTGTSFAARASAGDTSRYPPAEHPWNWLSWWRQPAESTTCATPYKATQNSDDLASGNESKSSSNSCEERSVVVSGEKGVKHAVSAHSSLHRSTNTSQPMMRAKEKPRLLSLTTLKWLLRKVEGEFRKTERENGQKHESEEEKGERIVGQPELVGFESSSSPVQTPPSAMPSERSSPSLPSWDCSEDKNNRCDGNHRNIGPDTAGTVNSHTRRSKHDGPANREVGELEVLPSSTSGADLPIPTLDSIFQQGDISTRAGDLTGNSLSKISMPLLWAASVAAGFRTPKTRLFESSNDQGADSSASPSRSESSLEPGRPSEQQSDIENVSRTGIFRLRVPRILAWLNLAEGSAKKGSSPPLSQAVSFPLPPAASVLRQRAKDFPFFPARVPRRPPGYRWVVSRLSSEGRRRKVGEKADEMQGAKRSSSNASSSEIVAGKETRELKRRSRRMRAYVALSGVTGKIVNRLRRSPMSRDTGADSEQPSLDNGVTQAKSYDPRLVGKWASVKVSEDSDVSTDSSSLPALPWWQYGAATAMGLGLGLARPIANRLSGLSSAPDSTSWVRRSVRVLKRHPNMRRASSGSTDVGGVPTSEKVDVPNAISALTSSSGPNRHRRTSGVRSLLKRIRTTLRRAKLLLLLRRASRARSKPLLSGVDTAISTLPVPLAASGSGGTAGSPQQNMASAAAKEAPAKVPISDTMTKSVPVVLPTAPSATTAVEHEAKEILAPQAVGGGAWNLFGFFPKDKEDAVGSTTEQRGSSSTTDGGATDSVHGDEDREALAWPMPVQADGNDSGVQVEAGMLEALRAAFGYRQSDPEGPTAPTTQPHPPDLSGSVSAVASTDVSPESSMVNAVPGETGDNIQGGDSMSQTSRYLNDLSPATEGEFELDEREEDGRWRGAEAAAAGAAAGAAVEAAAVAAATITTAAESLPFGSRDDHDPGWQASGRWLRKRDAEENDASFGKGSIGVKVRPLDPLKAQDMTLDPYSSTGLKRSVPSQDEPRAQRRRAFGFLAAAASLYRLPRPWKTMATHVTAAASASSRGDGKNLGIQDVALRQLGRVGVGQIASSMLLVSAEIALQVDSVEELSQFREAGGMSKLLMALTPRPYTTKATGISAIRNLLRVSPESVATDILEMGGAEAMAELRRLVGAPGEPWSAAAASAAAAATDSFDAMRLQAEAVQLLQEMSMASDEALAIVRDLPDLVAALRAIASPGAGPLSRIRDRVGRYLAGASMVGSLGVGNWLDGARRMEAPASQAAVSAASKLLSMLGVHEWKPRQPGQRGLRILSLDGGGTRGVMTIALLREVLKDMEKDVYETFDIICGTSTGGILAMLFAAEKQSIEAASELYDSLIVRIFRKDILGNAKLVLIQAQYSAIEWESILQEILGERRMIDISEDPESPKVIVCSTIINTNPLQMMLWRNYGYRMDEPAVYKGDYRVTMRQCLRATTAAPSYFTPVADGDMLYADGAFMANNPTSIALTEAKLLYPDVPIECVLSVGTGFYVPKKDEGGMSWNTVVNQLVNSATDTEGVDSMISTFLSRDTYFRFNPSIEHFSIDETRPEKLKELKDVAKEYARRPEVKARIEELQRVLNGETGFGLPGFGTAITTLSSAAAAAGRAAAAALEAGAPTTGRKNNSSRSVL